MAQDLDTKYQYALDMEWYQNLMVCGTIFIGICAVYIKIMQTQPWMKVRSMFIKQLLNFECYSMYKEEPSV